MKNAAADRWSSRSSSAGARTASSSRCARWCARGWLRPPLLIFVQSVERAMQLFHALVYDGLHVGVLHAERTAARGRRRRRTRRAAVARRPTTPRTSRVDPRRLFPRPSARDCPTNGGLTNAAPPEPIDGRRAATQPTDDPAVRARRPPHRPPPRTVTAPPTRPPRPPTPRRDHARRRRSGRAAASR